MLFPFILKRQLRLYLKDYLLIKADPHRQQNDEEMKEFIAMHF
jgi:hypothetical protein